MNEQPKCVDDAIRRTVGLLIAGKYAELEHLSGGTRLTAEEMRQAVIDYRRELSDAPDGFPSRADVVTVKGASPQRWSVNVPLWTKEEGPSDLTLSLTVIEADDAPGYAVEIDDLHVL